MFFLILSIIGSALISIVMRFGENHAKHKTGILMSNYITCCILGASSAFMSGLSPEGGIGFTLGLGVITGVLYLLGLVFIQINISKNGVVLTSAFSQIGGLLIPLAAGIVLFKEMPTVLKLIGSAIAIAAIIVINYDKSNTNAASKALLIALFAIEGTATVSAKIFNAYGNPVYESLFLFFTFTVAGIICFMLMLKRKERIGLKELLFGIGVGIPNFFASKFLLLALNDVPAIIAYPTRGVGTILVLSLAGILLFNEKLKKHQWLAIGAIMISVILLNI
ncbi:MAG: hypothetical protein E7235_03440 [Lachnospiraceae bacterium]|nr:hypothetical protein [Lachnospiraceae bacterium]